MPRVLTTNALILCPHSVRGTSIPSDPKWLVNGGAVLLENDVGTLTCPICVGYRLQSMGLNATQIDGRKVILTTDFNLTYSRLPLVMTDVHTTIDNSSPTPIPPGGTAPPIPAELADMTPPVVIGVLPALTFNSTTMLPPTATATFTLISGHPLRWLLTLINEPQHSHLDVTNGLPPGLVVAPPGGSWPASPLTVSVTMTADYMASLTTGTHHVFMSGVSQRGLSHFAEVQLVVT